MKKVLVTGGNGYFGTKIIEQLLRKKYSVYVIDGFYSGNNNLIKLANNKLKIFNLNLIKFHKIVKYFEKYQFDIVIHCASLVGEEACLKNKSIAKKINLELTKKIFQISVKYKVKHFIYTSTCSNYGAVKDRYLKENQKLTATGLYSKYKILSEKFLKKNKNSKIKITIFRFGTLYGASLRTRFDLLINDMVLSFFKNKKIDIYSPFSWRPYLHIYDASRAILIVMTKQKKMFDLYNLCSMNILKIELVKKIFNVIKRGKYNIIQNKFGQRDYRVDSSKFINLYKFKFKFSLNKSVKELIKFIKKEKLSVSKAKKFKYISNYKINLN